MPRAAGLKFEKIAWAAGRQWVAGVDEVGVGALAGPVVAGAVILRPERTIASLKDSKELTGQERERLYRVICEKALVYAVAFIDEKEIDRINIFQASRKAMREAIARLSPRPDFVLADGRRLDSLDIDHQAIVHGDRISKSIAAASIIAKVTRDQYMREAHNRYPDYGWDRNVGYGTRFHLEALRLKGPSPMHRLTFQGVS